MPPKPFKPPRPSASGVKKTPKTKRPSTSTSTRKSTSSTTATKPTSRASGSSAFSLPALDSSDSEADPFASTDARAAQQTPGEEEEDEEDVTVIPDEEDERTESIPPELLARLLHEFFTHDATRLSKEASGAVGRYMETFVREAMARAAFMRREVQDQTGGGGGGDGFLEVRCFHIRFGIGFLFVGFVVQNNMELRIVVANAGSQVEDLEKLAPQLLLDF